MGDIPNHHKLCLLCEQSWRERQRPHCNVCGLANHAYLTIGTGQEAALRAVSREIKYGRLAPPTEYKCVDCGCQATLYEHRDYNKPLDVVPTCRSCNAKRGYAIPKKMEFNEFVALVMKKHWWTRLGLTVDHLEPLRQKYWPKKTKGKKA